VLSTCPQINLFDPAQFLSFPPHPASNSPQISRAQRVKQERAMGRHCARWHGPAGPPPPRSPHYPDNFPCRPFLGGIFVPFCGFLRPIPPFPFEAPSFRLIPTPFPKNHLPDGRPRLPSFFYARFRGLCRLRPFPESVPIRAIHAPPPRMSRCPYLPIRPITPTTSNAALE
jgi:hypothetical protein